MSVCDTASQKGITLEMSRTCKFETKGTARRHIAPVDRFCLFGWFYHGVQANNSENCIQVTLKQVNQMTERWGQISRAWNGNLHVSKGICL